ncbi:MAG: tRNA-2-methylthio-N6-dimethylallyladenosine synthase [Actinomycetota bacterium]|jgi:tRNA-2-methylthio-N6-dimethylallyladenosine synthase|nr:tRNA-2-methylthio-N6-dimethylallyladenosine synthase [Actinomycetota bacterium]
MSQPTYFITTYGCQMNEHDSERLAGMLEAEGYAKTDSPDEAAVVLFNTCCIREKADTRLYGQLGHIKSIKDRRPDMKIVVGGCLAQKDQSLIQQKAPYVDVVLGTHNLASLPRLLRESDAAPSFEILEQTEVFPSALPARRSSPWHAWVSISIGCNNACTFCIVPAVRGKEVSRRVGDIAQEVQMLVDDGVVEVTLLGQNVNSYGRDLDGTPLFAHLLRELDHIPGLERVRFTSPHPKDFKADTVSAMAECRTVCEHIHLPVQAGSDAVLKRMKRAYSRAKYLDKVEMVRAAIPGVAITTDIIVGFPGETEDEFAETLSLVEEARYDAAYTFQYSSRPRTEAADLPDHLPKEVVQERFDRLVDLQIGISHEQNRKVVGTTEQVLVEGASKKDPSKLTGRTRTNKLVHFDDTGAGAGTFAKVAITAAHPHFLEGTPIGPVSTNETPSRGLLLPMATASTGCSSCA